MQTLSTILTVSTLLAGTAGAALAQSQGEWTLGLGVGYLEPDSSNGTLAGQAATVGDDTQAIITAEYFIRDNIGIELLAATPFKHSIALGGTNIGETKHLPPTISLNYHFANNSAWTPYVGAGLNYTVFFDESTALGDLDIDDSFGLSVQAGVDYALSDKAAMRLNVRYFDIESDVKLDGADIGKVEIDPFLIGISYVQRF